MKVKELSKYLSECNPEAEVCVSVRKMRSDGSATNFVADKDTVQIDRPMNTEELSPVFIEGSYETK